MNGNRVGAGARERLYASTTNTFDPEHDLDYIAIEYALNGERVKLTVAEKMHAAQLLSSRGFSDKAIGERIGCKASSIAIWRSNGWKHGPAPQAPVRQQRPEPVCGEPRMYRQHLKNGERCDTCRAANAAADRRYRLTGSRKEVQA